jgi:UDP-galactopyranose mutase
MPDCDNWQGNAVVNYTAREIPFTRIIEHKHFEFGSQPYTYITKEFSCERTNDTEPYYPINDAKNQEIYAKYQKAALKESKVLFGGRLAEYKYYNMDQVIESAVKLYKSDNNL